MEQCSGSQEETSDGRIDAKPAVQATQHSDGAVIDVEPVQRSQLRETRASGKRSAWALDSGATETVVPPDILASHELREGGPCKRGVEYEVANGVQIPNLGEREFVGVTEGGGHRGPVANGVAQVCDVNRGLLRVRKVTKAGNRVIFDEDRSYFRKQTNW